MTEKFSDAEDLIADLRSRINPIYAAQLGTESYERRICAEALEAQADECKAQQQKHEAFAAAVERCYRMLLTEPDTRGALFKAENILRKALADMKAATTNAGNERTAD